MSIEQIKEDTGDEFFKECDVTAKAYPMMPKVAAQIEEQHQIIHQAMEDLRNKSSSANPLVIMLRARQKIEMLKVPLFVELTEKHLRRGKYVVWFLNFKETKKVLTEKLLSIPKNADDPEDLHSENANDLHSEDSNEYHSDRLLTTEDIDFIDGTNTAEERETIRKDLTAETVEHFHELHTAVRICEGLPHLPEVKAGFRRSCCCTERDADCDKGCQVNALSRSRHYILRAPSLFF